MSSEMINSSKTKQIRSHQGPSKRFKLDGLKRGKSDDSSSLFSSFMSLSGKSLPSQPPKKIDMEQLLENNQSRYNWNVFVGDERFKTDFFLRFKRQTTNNIYRLQVIASSLYSLRLWLCIEFILLWGARSAIEADPISITSEQDHFSAELPVSGKSWTLTAAIMSIGCLILGLFSSVKRAWPIPLRQASMSLLSMLIQLYLIRTYFETFNGVRPQDRAFQFVLQGSILMPTFITSILIVEDWIAFVILALSQTLVALFLYELRYLCGMESIGSGDFGQELSLFGFLKHLVQPLMLFTFLFAIFEKINKERFVINYSNQQTRKFFGELIDSSCASLTIQTDGSISFYNSQFRTLILEKLNFSQLPANIFDIFDENLYQKESLQQMIHDVKNADKGGGNSMKNAENEEKSQKVFVLELRLPVQQQRKKYADSKDIEESKDLVQKQPGLSSRKGLIKEELELYEMLRFTCKTSCYSADNSLILSIQEIADYKGYAQLIVQQSHILQEYLENIQKDLEMRMIEKVEGKAMNKDHHSVTSIIADNLSVPQLLLSVLDQTQFQVRLLSIMSVAQTLWDAKMNEQEFKLNQVVRTLIERCVHNKLQHPEVTFEPNDAVPELIKADLEQLQLVLQTLIEFCLIYCKQQDKLSIQSTVEGLGRDSEDFDYMIGFKFTMHENSNFDKNKILEIFDMNNASQSYQEFVSIKGADQVDLKTFFTRRSIRLKYYLETFGIGMLLLPILVQIIRGDIDVQFQRKKRKNTKSRAGSVISGVAGGDIQSVSDASAPQRKLQTMTVKLKVPIFAVQREDEEIKEVAEDWVGPPLYPQKLSNRLEKQGIDHWMCGWSQNQSLWNGFIKSNEAFQHSTGQIQGQIIMSENQRHIVTCPDQKMNARINDTELTGMFGHSLQNQDPKLQLPRSLQKLDRNDPVAMTPQPKARNYQNFDMRMMNYAFDLSSSKDNFSISDLRNLYQNHNSQQRPPGLLSEKASPNNALSNAVMDPRPSIKQTIKQEQLKSGEQVKESTKSLNDESKLSLALSEENQSQSSVSNSESNTSNEKNSAKFQSRSSNQPVISDQVVVMRPKVINNKELMNAVSMQNIPAPQNVQLINLRQSQDSGTIKTMKSSKFNHNSEHNSPAHLVERQSSSDSNNQEVEELVRMETPNSKNEKQLAINNHPLKSLESLQLEIESENSNKSNNNPVQEELKDSMMSDSGIFDNSQSADNNTVQKRSINQSLRANNNRQRENINQEQADLRIVPRLVDTSGRGGSSIKQGSQHISFSPESEGRARFSSLGHKSSISMNLRKNNLYKFSLQNSLKNQSVPNASSTSKPRDKKVLDRKILHNLSMHTVSGQIILGFTPFSFFSRLPSQFLYLIQPKQQRFVCKRQETEELIFDEIFIDENIPGEPQQREELMMLQEDNYHESDEDVVLSTQQKRDLKQRQKKILQDYRARLKIMKQEELTRKQEILRQKGLDNNDLQDFMDIPSIQIRLDDHLGQGHPVRKLEKEGASASHLTLSNKSRENLRRNEQNLFLMDQNNRNREQAIENKEQTDKDTLMYKFKNFQVMRRIKRRTQEQHAKTNSSKHDHNQVVPTLTEVIDEPFEENSISVESSIHERRPIFDEREIVFAEEEEISEQEVDNSISNQRYGPIIDKKLSGKNYGSELVRLGSNDVNSLYEADDKEDADKDRQSIQHFQSDNQSCIDDAQKKQLRSHSPKADSLKQSLYDYLDHLQEEVKIEGIQIDDSDSVSNSINHPHARGSRKSIQDIHRENFQLLRSLVRMELDQINLPEPLKCTIKGVKKVLERLSKNRHASEKRVNLGLDSLQNSIKVRESVLSSMSDDKKVIDEKRSKKCSQDKDGLEQLSQIGIENDSVQENHSPSVSSKADGTIKSQRSLEKQILVKNNMSLDGKLSFLPCEEESKAQAVCNAPKILQKQVKDKSNQSKQYNKFDSISENLRMESISEENSQSQNYSGDKSISIPLKVKIQEEAKGERKDSSKKFQSSDSFQDPENDQKSFEFDKSLRIDSQETPIKDETQKKPQKKSKPSRSSSSKSGSYVESNSDGSPSKRKIKSSKDLPKSWRNDMRLPYLASMKKNREEGQSHNSSSAQGTIQSQGSQNVGLNISRQTLNYNARLIRNRGILRGVCHTSHGPDTYFQQREARKKDESNSNLKMTWSLANIKPKEVMDAEVKRKILIGAI